MFGNVLIIDDDPIVLESLSLLLKYDSVRIDTLDDPNQISEQLNKFEYELILLDMNFSTGRSSGNEGITWLNRILKQDPEAIVIMITAYADIKLAVEAMKHGATDFIQKPWGAEKLIATMKAAQNIKLSLSKIKQLENSNQSMKDELKKYYPKMIGQSSVMNKLRAELLKVAKTDANVLISGENGTGKELLARELHYCSNRNNKAFTSVDMGSISDSLFESEMFGHKKGAFTDAKEDRVGRFEAANGGSLFLDEISNLSVTMQVKLLTSLQNREIIRIGTNKPTKIDVRLISATNKDLHKLIEKGIFREDLFYRIRTIHLKVPPLREREGDIMLLSDYFLNKYAMKYDKPGIKISQKAYKKLQNYSWPGNVRELEHAIENAVVLCDKTILDAGDFPFRAVPSKNDEVLNLVEVEKRIIMKALDKHKGNFTYAARELGISRTTLYLKLKRYEI